jgi:tetratricopeptide (TPR) repeat protein
MRQAVDVLLLQDNADAAVLLCEERVLAGPDPLTDASTGAGQVVPDLVSAELLAACARALGRVGGEARAARLLEQQLDRLAATADETPAIEAELRWGLAETAALSGDLEAAESNLDQVVALLQASDDQRLATALNNLGSIRFERGRPLEASTDLESALDLLEDPAVTADPTLRRDVLANYAIVLRTLDRNAEALAVESRLIDLATDPDWIEPAAGN